MCFLRRVQRLSLTLRVRLEKGKVYFLELGQRTNYADAWAGGSRFFFLQPERLHKRFKFMFLQTPPMFVGRFGQITKRRPKWHDDYVMH